MMKSIGAVAAIVQLLLCCVSHAQAGKEGAEKNELKVMTFNIWGDRSGPPTAKVIKAAQADVVGLQEVSKAGAKRLAGLLGWNYSHRGGPGIGILTRHEILEEYQLGIKIRTDSGREAYVLNVHFRPAPYQPYQLLKIPYGNGAFIETEKEAIVAAEKARGDQVKILLKTIEELPNKELPVFVTGDFNEPSHLDWTDAAAKAKRHPIKVSYPASLAMVNAGFADAYRAVYPDEMKRPGYTWTPTTKPDDPKDHHDRIDFVYFKGAGVEARGAEVVGENEANADIFAAPYPSDHRAVVATFAFKGSGAKKGDARPSEADNGGD